MNMNENEIKNKYMSLCIAEAILEKYKVLDSDGVCYTAEEYYEQLRNWRKEEV